jgi:LPS-assembly lipoprotein
MKRLAVLLGIGLFLAGCGLQPIYAGGTQGAAATALSGVAVAPIPERIGQLVREDLLRRMNRGSGADYRLDVTLSETSEGFGIRGDESVARERVTLIADFTLIDARSGAVVDSGRARSDSAVDVVRSDYATVVAERAAAERNARLVAQQIIGRIALTLKARAKAPLPGS